MLICSQGLHPYTVSGIIGVPVIAEYCTGIVLHGTQTQEFAMAGKVQISITIALFYLSIVSAASPQQLISKRRVSWGSDAQQTTQIFDSDLLQRDRHDLNISTRAKIWDMPEANHGDVTPSVTAKVEPLFFQRASMVMVQLVRDHLSKTFLGSLETFADGELDAAPLLRLVPVLLCVAVFLQYYTDYVASVANTSRSILQS